MTEVKSGVGTALQDALNFSVQGARISIIALHEKPVEINPMEEIGEVLSKTVDTKEAGKVIVRSPGKVIYIEIHYPAKSARAPPRESALSRFSSFALFMTHPRKALIKKISFSR